MKKLAKILNNFKLTAIVTSIIQALGVLTSLGFLLSYTFSGGGEETADGSYFLYPGFYFQQDNPMPQILGMIFFFSCIIAIIVGIMVIYKLVPFIQNKEKMVPTKGMLIAGSVNAIFVCLNIVLSIVLLASEDSQAVAGFIISIIGGVIYTAACALMIYPIKRCEFFMPEIKRD